MKRPAIALIAMLLFGTAAHATTIDFDNGTEGSSVGNFYSGRGVIFENALFTSNLGLAGTSGSLGIRAQDGGLINTCQWLNANPVTALIASGASSVSIQGADVGINGLQMDAYDRYGNLVDSKRVFGRDNGFDEFYTLTDASSGITRVDIYQVQNVTGDGIVLDDFRFTPAAPAPVPEPSTIVLLGAALAGAGIFRTYRRSRNRGI